MKKFYLFIAFMLLINAGFAQSPRLVLVEEFTGETCGPCAVYNPAFNATMESFPGTVISLKYQNNIPSAGANFYAYNTADISNRTTFYSNTYSPHGFIDGNYWDGNVASVTASQFTARTAVTSPFSIVTTHSFSPAHDIINVHVEVTASEVVTNANMKLRVAVAERNVYGYTSPNGESEYSHVMRKLLPTGTGTALNSTWAIGDVQTFDFSWTITVPTNPNIDMPIWAMLEAITWVQDDATKEIMQAGHSPAVVTLDASANQLSMDALTCNGNITPTLDVENLELDPITSLDIDYSVDGGTPSTYNWVGTIAAGASANIQLPIVSLGAGAHSISTTITNVNGSPELVNTNNVIASTTGQVMPAVSAYSQNFLPVNFTLMNWTVGNPDNFVAWARVANTATPGSGGAKMDFYNSPASQIDYLYNLNAVDLTTATTPQLTFKVAHKRYSAAYSDRIEVLLSTDCGSTWTTIWNKAGAALATVATFTTSAYSPVTADWRSELVDLSSYIGQSNVIIAFKATSAYGNNAYIDEVNLTGVTSVSEVNPNLFSMYPVPTAGEVTLSLDKISASTFNLAVTSVDGKVVRQEEVRKNSNSFNMDLSDLSNGTYFVRITTDNETSINKIVIEK